MILPGLRLSLARSLFCGTLLACLPLGCNRAPAAPEETPPPAPVKWLEARQFFVEEWTEIVGTTQPLPDRAARVSAAVEGREAGKGCLGAGNHDESQTGRRSGPATRQISTL